MILNELTHVKRVAMMEKLCTPFDKRKCLSVFMLVTHTHTLKAKRNIVFRTTVLKTLGRVGSVFDR